MNRPEHLNCVNTPEGIRRINEEQEAYDRDPEEYEKQEQYYRDMQQQQEENDRDFYAQLFNEREIFPKEDNKRNTKHIKVNPEEIPF